LPAEDCPARFHYRRYTTHRNLAPAFEIETIPRVGYRLKLSGAAQSARSSYLPATTQDVAAASPISQDSPQWALPWKWIGVGLVTAAVGVAIAVVLWPLQPKPPTKWTVARSEVLVASTLIARYPAISPDDSVIAYSAGKDEVTRKIFLQRISGGDPLQLTDDSYDDTSPAWSPDGAQIAYAAYKEGEPCRLIVTPVPAGAPRELARCRTDERSHVSWSVSGGELFFLDRPDVKSPNRIMRYDLASGRRTDLTHPSAGSLGEGEPALSPDGRWITFERHLSDLVDRQILLDLRTGVERVLIPDPTGDGAAWSEDSRTVFVETKHDRDFALWALPIDGGAPTRILSSPDDVGRLSSGPHGLLAVEITQGYDGLARPPRTIGGGPDFLAPERGSDISPDIARDGTIAMTADRPGGAGLWLMPKGGTFRKLIGINAQAVAYSEARWSPDGSRIAFTAPMGDAFGIRIITAAGSDIATIRFRGSSLNTPAWSADGRALIFPGRDAQGWRLWRVDLARTGTMTPISGTGWEYVRTRNNAIYGVRDGGPGVWRIDGVPRRITPKPGPDASNLWTIAGDEIAYVDRPSGEQSQILAQPIDGGPARVMAQVPEYCWCAGFAVDPVSGTVIYPAALGQESDIELLHLVRN
jgi:Tol biopolymer transport system component